MNKCIKIIIKNCKELEWKELNKILFDLRYKTSLACNKAMTYYYTYAVESMNYKTQTGNKINEIERFGKSYKAWVENRMNEIMTGCNSGNVAQTNQFVSNKYGNDKSKIFKGEVTIPNFKRDMPIIIHNKNYKILQENKGFEIELGLFNREYQKEHNLKRITLEIDKLDGNKKSTLNKIINGIYKQGSMQIKLNNKNKWELIISFSFENEDKQLDKNRILGIDLGITNVATMSVYDDNFKEYDRLNWKECQLDGKELIHFRQQIEARKRQLQIASKNVGDGRIGHGTITRMKPLEQINNKISRFKDTYNHKTSRYIVDLAVKYNCGIIQMEDLSGFSSQQSESLLKNWSYYDLQAKVKYKAEELGIEVRLINPQYTSKRCNKCGCIDNANRDCKSNQAKFECVVCGNKENADINASKNIALPDIENIIKEQLELNKKIEKKNKAV